MALCEICGADVQPGDVVTLGEYTERHNFCSVEHRQLYLNGEQLTVDDAIAESLTTEAPEDEAVEHCEEEMEVWICPICDFEAKTKAGLATHVRSKHK